MITRLGNLLFAKGQPPRVEIHRLQVGEDEFCHGRRIRIWPEEADG